MVVLYPLMSAFQEICARIGRVIGHGIVNNIRLRYPRLLYGMVGLVVLANIFDLGADIQAMDATARLLVPGPTTLYGVFVAALSVIAQLLIPYSKYVSYLKWLTLSLLAYIGAAFFVHISWTEALSNTFAPRVSFSKPYFLALIAVLGTTISPYLFFWQASQEAEEVRRIAVRRHSGGRRVRPSLSSAEFERIRILEWRALI